MQPIFIPKKLRRIKGKPGCELLPKNVLIGRFEVVNKEKRLYTVLYTPDFSTFRATGSRRCSKKISMKYPNKYDAKYWLQISRDDQGTYICKKYSHGRWVGEAIGPRDNWGVFFFHVGLLGLVRGEPCFIENDLAKGSRRTKNRKK
jgi:hypothetical protein